MASPYKIHLDTYDGPLDLLLDLIRKQEMDIHNIPIAQITGQYLEYLHKLEKLDIDVSADFIYMAATLILIKSKMLLPPDPLAGPDEQIDITTLGEADPTRADMRTLVLIGSTATRRVERPNAPPWLYSPRRCAA